MTAAIRHTVTFRLRDDADADAFFDRLLALQTIEGVRDFELLHQVGSKNDFTHGLWMSFDDQGAYDAYDAHPDHQAFVGEVWERDVEDFLELDYQPVDARHG